MLKVVIDNETGIAQLEPHGALTKEDFSSATKIVDNYLDEHDKLNGLIIHTEKFPGWDSFGAMISHLEFAKEHHKKVSRVAIVTDSVLGDFAEKIASHFIAAEIKHFSFQELDKAESWIKG